MDEGVDRGDVDEDNGDLYVVASVARVFSSPPKDGVVFSKMEASRDGSPSGGSCVGGCVEARAPSFYIGSNNSF